MSSKALFSGATPISSSQSVASSAVVLRNSTGVAGPQDANRKSDAELEAERLWWSEASERQVKELEASFGGAFRKTAERLSADVASSKERLEILMEAEKKQRNSLMSELANDVAVRYDRLEQLMETEKNQRQAALIDLRRNFDQQQATLNDLAQRQQDDLKGLESRFQDKLHAVLREISVGELDRSRATVCDQGQIEDVQKLVARLQNDFNGLQLQTTSKDARLMAEFTEHKAQVSAMKHDFEDLRAASSTAKGMDLEQTRAMEDSLASIRQDVLAVQEIQQLREAQAAASSVEDKVVALEAAMDELRRSQDQQHRNTARVDSSLEESCAEIKALRTASDSRNQTDEEVRAFHEVIMQSTCDLGRGLEEISSTIVVAEQRLRKEIEEVRSLAQSPQMADTVKSIEDQRVSWAVEFNVVRARLDAAVQQLGTLQAEAEMQRPRTATKEDLELQRATVEADVQGLRRKMEALEGELSTLSAETSRDRAMWLAARDDGAEAKRQAEEVIASCREMDKRLDEGLSQERSLRAEEIANLKRLAEASAPELTPAVTPTQSEGGAGKVGTNTQAVDEVRKELRIVQVAMRVLEQRCQDVVDSQPHDQKELRSIRLHMEQADLEVQRLTSSVGVLCARVDACESGLWKASSELPAFIARLDVVEADVSRLECESAEIGALRRKLGTMQAEAQSEALVQNLTTMHSDAKQEASKTGSQSTVATPSMSEFTALDAARRIEPAFTTTTNTPHSEPVGDSEPSTLPPPMLSADLKSSISRLVQRVNTTLAARPTSESMSQMSRAEQAMQELRERNVLLREENVGLAEELLKEGMQSTGCPHKDAPVAGNTFTPLPAAKPAWQDPPIPGSSFTPLPASKPTWQAVPIGGSGSGLPRFRVDAQPVRAGCSVAMPVSSPVPVPRNPTVVIPPSNVSSLSGASQMPQSGTILVPSGTPLASSQPQGGSLLASSQPPGGSVLASQMPQSGSMLFPSGTSLASSQPQGGSLLASSQPPGGPVLVPGGGGAAKIPETPGGSMIVQGGGGAALVSQRPSVVASAQQVNRDTSLAARTRRSTVPAAVAPQVTTREQSPVRLWTLTTGGGSLTSPH